MRKPGMISQDTIDTVTMAVCGIGATAVIVLLGSINWYYGLAAFIVYYLGALGVRVREQTKQRALASLLDLAHRQLDQAYRQMNNRLSARK